MTNSILQLITIDKATIAHSLQDIDLWTLLLFLLLVANIIRFYHGNMRHLDATYTAELGKGSARDLKSSGSGKTGIDFFVIFFQSVAFAILSFLLQTPTEFFTFFAALLIIDVIWFLSVYQLTTDRKAFEHQKRWTLNNTIAVFALLIIIAIPIIVDSTARMYLLWGILALNTVADFCISWRFYFPSYAPSG